MIATPSHEKRGTTVKDKRPGDDLLAGLSMMLRTPWPKPATAPPKVLGGVAGAAA